MYSLRKKKEILLVIGTALNRKPTWASHIPTEDPEKVRPTAQPGGPMVPRSVNQCPLRLWAQQAAPALGTCTGSAHSGRAQPADRRCSPRAGGREECCVSGKEKRGERNVLFNQRHLSVATYSHPLGLVIEWGAVLIEPARSEWTSPVLSLGLNRINKS